ncbi:c-type cytochrome [Aquincola sp. S2]|uniref:C-type cytochrome n=1 Tax=Pseudaquabacterium terrae TaxID=2732868 RepID=A0ABX2EFM6_9BURK|nr:cytochrome c [Aquabacterium terrae]NRF67442.1 c-type cytochrome [Aquabacterium terrae]
MKRWIKITLGALASLLAAGAATVGFAHHRSQTLQARIVDVPRQAIALADDAATLNRGRYLYLSRGCADCHGANAGGRVFVDDAGSGLKLAGPNISPGADSPAARYRGEDWERALRHGVKPDGRPLMVMPSQDFARWTDADVAAVASYLRSVPAVQGGAALLQLPLPVRVLYGLGVIPDAAARIDHRLPPAQPVAEGVTVAHGQYVAQSCIGCHGPGLSGGSITGGPPDWPAAANLTPGSGSAMLRYASAEQFRAMMRSGKRPDGSAISPVMPFEALAQMSDVDLDATFVYLKSVPARAAGGH